MVTVTHQLCDTVICHSWTDKNVIRSVNKSIYFPVDGSYRIQTMCLQQQIPVAGGGKTESTWGWRYLFESMVWCAGKLAQEGEEESLDRL